MKYRRNFSLLKSKRFYHLLINLWLFIQISIFNLSGQVPVDPISEAKIQLMAGEPRQESIILQARVPREWQSLAPDLSIEFQYSSDSTFPTQNVFSILGKNQKKEKNGIFKVRLQNLKPGTWYWYRCRVAQPKGIRT